MATPVRQRGFTYLGILAAIVLMGLMLSAIAQVWRVTGQRERETQLLFVGGEIRMAIGHYYLLGRRYPESLQDLVEDDRSPTPRRFLRKLYSDPISGAPDWTLIRGPDGGIMGVASASMSEPIKRAGFDQADESFADAKCYCDWKFLFDGSRGFWHQQLSR